MNSIPKLSQIQTIALRGMLGKCPKYLIFSDPIVKDHKSYCFYETSIDLVSLFKNKVATIFLMYFVK